MMHREEFLKKHPNIKGSMIAYSDDGEKLGKVTTLFEDSINIEKGLFFPKDYTISYDDVLDVHDNAMVINMHSERLSGLRGTAPEGMERGAAGRWDKFDELNTKGEIDIPLREEDIQIQKNRHQAGEVRVHKVIHTETKTTRVPVSKEDVVIERIPVTEAGVEAAGEDAFMEESMTIPLMEEGVDVLTSQHVRERVHLKKESHIEEQQVSTQVRREDLEVVTEGRGESRTTK